MFEEFRLESSLNQSDFEDFSLDKKSSKKDSLEVKNKQEYNICEVLVD